MREISRPSAMFTVLALAGGAFFAARSGEAFAELPVVLLVVAATVIAGFGVPRLTDAIVTALARVRGGQLDNAPAVARWWWMAAVVTGSRAVGDALVGKVDLTLPVAIIVVWFGVGLVGTLVITKAWRWAGRRHG